MADLRTHLERLTAVAPPSRSGFEEELWSRICASERSSARRRRLVAIAATSVIVAAASAAGVLAFNRATPKMVETRVVCTPASSIAGFVFGTGTDGRNPGVYVSTGTVYGIFGNDSLHHPGIIWPNPRFCVKSTAAIPFSASGLAQSSVFTVTKEQPKGGVGVRCFAPHVLARLHETFDATGKPTAFTFAVRNQRTGKPLEFATGTSRRVTVYFASSCQPS